MSKEKTFMIRNSLFGIRYSILAVSRVGIGKHAAQQMFYLSDIGNNCQDLILAIKTGCFAPGGKINAKRTAVLFCLFGLWPKIQAPASQVVVDSKHPQKYSLKL